MPEQSSPSRRIDDPAIAQRSIVLMLLDADRDRSWTRTELEAELHDVQPDAIDTAIESLIDGAVAERGDERLWATQPTRHLNSLGMICV